MIKKPLKARALPPDPNQSLFKFKLSWLDPFQPGQIKIQTWYSFDYDSERQAFPYGLDKELRSQWKQLLGLCYKHTELYDFVKWLWPYRQAQSLDLYLPNWPELSAMIPLIESKYGWQLLETYGHSCGFDSLRFQTVSRSYPRQPGHSPGRVDFRQFYGYGYFHRNNFIVGSLASGRLIKVDIYDNLMYHSDNFLHSLISIQPKNR